MVKTVNIIGAGIGGLSAAIAFAQRGAVVHVFEQAKTLSEVGAGLQLSPNATKVLHALGLEDQIRKASFEPNFATIRNGTTGAEFVSVPLKGHALGAYGAPYLHIHRADLHDILLLTARGLGVTINTSQRVVEYDANGFSGAAQADLCIDASGVRSEIAVQMNPTQPARFTNQIAWRGTVSAQDFPDNLIPPDATVWTGSGKHVVTYYLRGGSEINFVAVEETDVVSDAHWTSEGDIHELRRIFSGWHPALVELFKQATFTNIWALHDKDELARWSDGPVVLLGDACHPTLPFLAQGAAMAIEDAYILAQCVHANSNLKEALKQYEDLRKPRTTMLQNMARKNADMFHLTGSAGGLIPRLKLGIARMLPARLARVPFRKIYAYDATKLTD